jgi:ferritin-like protein
MAIPRTHWFSNKPVSIDLLVSPAVREFRRAYYDSLLTTGVKALNEMKDIEEIARELKGDPHESTKYLQAETLVGMLRELKSLLDNEYTFTRAASTPNAEGTNG